MKVQLLSRRISTVFCILAKEWIRITFSAFARYRDRALDFRDGLPDNPLLNYNYLVENQPGELDVLYLGNRNTIDNGAVAFDSTVDGDCIGVQPKWLVDSDQNEATAFEFPNALGFSGFVSRNSHVGILYQVAGGGSFDLNMTLVPVFDICGPPIEFTTTIDGPDWLGGGVNIGSFPGAIDVDCGTPDPTGQSDLTITEAIIDLTDFILDQGDFQDFFITSMSFGIE